VAAVATGTTTAGAQADGPPEIFYTTPQVARTAGGTPVRIYGAGLEGTTSVTFGDVPALDFKVIDGALLTATVPPAVGGAASSNTSVDIVITDDEGSATGTHRDGETTGLYYADATLTVTPETVRSGSAVDFGSEITVEVDGYAPSAGGVIIQMSPLVGFFEGGPDYCESGFCGPPPYVLPEDFVSTDANGDLTSVTHIDNLGTFNEFGVLYDPNVHCGPNQETADFGLPHCMVGFGQFAVGTLERFVTFEDDATPADPTLTLSSGSSQNGDTVSLSGVTWNNNAYFGSDTAPDDPGETQLLVEICRSDLTGCQPVIADAEVELTRYRTSSTSAPIEGVFTGATLSGTIVVDGAGCAPSCVVRVSQEGYDYDAYTGEGTGTYISATAPLAVTSGPPAGQSCAGQPATVVGTDGGDRLVGTDGPDVIAGLGGDDRIDGAGGDDIICAGAGNDTVDGGGGHDRIHGGAGDDRLVGSSRRDELLGAHGTDTLVGGAGNDDLVGGPDADICLGGFGTNTFNGCESKAPPPR